MGSSETVWCGASGGALLHSANGGASWTDQAANADPDSVLVWDNVWARKRGRGGAPGTVLVCAHYDSISELSSIETPDAPAPGADDNATGVAAVLELARACEGRDLRRDVIFVCYSGEEEGLLGSSHFAAKMASADEPLVAVLNMDMLGYADKIPEDADVVANAASVWVYEYMRRAAAAYTTLGVDVTVDDFMRRSDHASYWSFGYSSVLIIEDWELVYKHGNTSKDTLNHINFDVATLMTKGVAATAASLASPTSMPAVSSLDAVEVYPNPYKSSVHGGRVYFANLPPYSRIKLYNVAGEFITEGGNGAEPLWPLELETKAEPIKSSGVYFYVVESAAGEKKIGKLAVIR
jgi:Zn-dependent M28 family amino/carboxypeptidase